VISKMSAHRISGRSGLVCSMDPLGFHSLNLEVDVRNELVRRNNESHEESVGCPMESDSSKCHKAFPVASTVFPQEKMLV
jgi:hypothetical protein